MQCFACRTPTDRTWIMSCLFYSNCPDLQDRKKQKIDFQRMKSIPKLSTFRARYTSCIVYAFDFRQRGRTRRDREGRKEEEEARKCEKQAQLFLAEHCKALLSHVLDDVSFPRLTN